MTLLDQQTARVPLHERLYSVPLELDTNDADVLVYTAFTGAASGAFGTTPSPTSVVIEGRVAGAGWSSLKTITAEQATRSVVDVTGVSRVRVRQASFATDGASSPTHLTIPISLLSGDEAVLASSSSSSPTVVQIRAQGVVAGLSFDDTENAIGWASPSPSSSSIGVSGSQITINDAGLYTFYVTLRTDSSNRTELFIRTYIDTGSGLVQDTDRIVSDYVSRDGDQDTGAVTLIERMDLNAGDVVEFRGFGDTDGACVGLNAGTVLIVDGTLT